GHASRPRVQSERAAPKLAERDTAGATNQRSDARENLLDSEGFRDVIVCAAVDPLNFFVPASARRQHEHGLEHPRLPPAAQQSESVYFRQAEIEYDSIILLRLCEEIGLFTVGGRVDSIPGFRERFR